jgi:hypothetical protein
LKSWSYRESFALRIETSVPPLFLAIIAFIACGLAAPPIPAAGPIDLRAFHAEQGRKYQIAHAVFMIVAIFQLWLMSDFAVDSSNLVTDTIVLVALALVSTMAAIFHRQRWIQIGAPTILLLAAISFYGRLMEQ